MKPASRALVCCIVALAAAGICGAAVRTTDASLLMESRAAVRRALTHLAGIQKEDGSWQGHPAITALVVTAMIDSGQEGFGPQSEPVGRGLDFIRAAAQPDGGIYDRFYPAYSTSICAIALARAGLPQDVEMATRARDYLLEIQADESEGLSLDSPEYGGWGYERTEAGQPGHHADLSNTQFALEALRQLEHLDSEGGTAGGEGEPRKRTELAYDRAIMFLSRCQNLQETNDRTWAGTDGGFVYAPTESKAGEESDDGLRSYGSMTYAGLKSMVYARLDDDDARVRAAHTWLRAHWTVEENPGMGQQGLYYYYLTMSRALEATGQDVIVDAAGEEHAWGRELAAQLLKIQKADGSWTNENGRWMEQIPDLVTAYACIALEHAARGL